jgi:hypothetical protein
VRWEQAAWAFAKAALKNASPGDGKHTELSAAIRRKEQRPRNATPRVRGAGG